MIAELSKLRIFVIYNDVNYQGQYSLLMFPLPRELQDFINTLLTGYLTSSQCTNYGNSFTEV